MERSYASRSSGELATASGGGRPVKVIPLRHPPGFGSLSSSSQPWWWAAVGRARGMRPVEWAETALPCVAWMQKYRWKEDLQADLAAGITVGVMLVPQAMSYAKLAGLHPIYGLYTGFVPLFLYAIFGSSRQLAVGPVALVSLLVSNVLGGIVNSSSELYTELAILLAFMVGILECLMGLLRLGWLIRFISHSVISGFTTASAIVIGLSQIKYFLGYNVTRSSKIIPLIESIIAGADQFSWPPFVMGSAFLVVLLTMKHLGKSDKRLRFLRASGPLTTVVLGTIFVKIFHPPAIPVKCLEHSLCTSHKFDQRSCGSILNARYDKDQGDENSDSGSSYHVNAHSSERYINTSSVGSPLSDTPKSEVSEWSSSCFHNHTDNQLDTQIRQPSSNDVGGVLEALQRARISLRAKLCRPSPPSQNIMALPALDDLLDMQLSLSRSKPPSHSAKGYWHYQNQQATLTGSHHTTM